MLEISASQHAKDNTRAARVYLMRARDVLDLWRLLAPLHVEASIHNSIAAPAVFYNDCMYIEYHLITMGQLFSDRLPTMVSDVCSFIDHVPLIRNLAKLIFGRSLCELEDQLKGLLGEFVSSDYSADSVQSIGKLLVSISSSWRVSVVCV
jgi:hypothetical protein